MEYKEEYLLRNVERTVHGKIYISQLYRKIIGTINLQWTAKCSCPVDIYEDLAIELPNNAATYLSYLRRLKIEHLCSLVKFFLQRLYPVVKLYFFVLCSNNLFLHEYFVNSYRIINCDI